MEYDNTNKGVLFKYEKKNGPRDPDYTGSINVKGVECYLSAWINTSKNTGKKYMSLSATPKGDDYQQKSDKSPDVAVNAEDDSIPF